MLNSKRHKARGSRCRACEWRLQALCGLLLLGLFGFGGLRPVITTAVRLGTLASAALIWVYLLVHV